MTIPNSLQHRRGRWSQGDQQERRQRRRQKPATTTTSATTVLLFCIPILIIAEALFFVTSSSSSSSSSSVSSVSISVSFSLLFLSATIPAVEGFTTTTTSSSSSKIRNKNKNYNVINYHYTSSTLPTIRIPNTDTNTNAKRTTGTATAVTKLFATTASTEKIENFVDGNNNNNDNSLDVVGENRRGDASGAALRLEEVTVSRSGVSLIQNVNWRIEPNAKWALVGSNGCGKSTLLKAILNDLNDNNNKHDHDAISSSSSSSSSSIVDHLDIDGTITIGTKQQVGYLKQTAVSGSQISVFDEAASAMKDVSNARMKLRFAEDKVAAYDGGETITIVQDDTTGNTNNNVNFDIDNDAFQNDLKLLDTARKQYERLGGYTQEQEVHSLLSGLGFTNMTQPCSELSGGWQMRVSLAKMLLSKPSLALYDEPTNHLDRPTRSWLSQYLKNFQTGAMILVTHDIELLNVCDHIAEITGTEGSTKSIQIYKSCNYEQYLRQKKERAVSAQVEYEKNIEKAAALQAFVDKWGASATKAKAAQSRVKQIEKMKAQGLLDPPNQSITQIDNYKPRLELPEPPPLQGLRRSDSDDGNYDDDDDDDNIDDENNGILLSLKNNAAVGYTIASSSTSNDSTTIITSSSNNSDASSKKIELISDINLEIRQGMKILIRGSNGSGKTTLLDTLRGNLPLLCGNRACDGNLRLGVFTQDLAQQLDPSQRAVDIVTAYARSSSDDNGGDGNIFITDQDARRILGGLGLQGEKALRQIGQLSGGEKARVALAMFALKPSNLYLLDESSNHLDKESVEALSEVLSDWGDGKGSIVVISHDKAFCEQIGFTHVLTITDEGRLRLEQRDANINDWDSSRQTYQKSTAGPSEIHDGDSDGAVIDTELDTKRRKMAFNAPRRISKIEKLVMRKEETIAQLDEEMLANGSDVGKLVDLSKEKELLENEVMELMEEWEELETLVAEMT